MKRQSVIGIGILATIAVYWIGSEVYWSSHVSPRDSKTLEEFQERFRDQFKVSDFIRDGQHFRIASGPLPPAYIFTFPSSAPKYVFDDSGKFIEWAADPGNQNDDSPFHLKWIKNE